MAIMKAVTLDSRWVALLALALCAGAVRGDDTSKASPAESPPVVKAETAEPSPVKSSLPAKSKVQKPPLGWQEVYSEGELYWCRKARPTGSRVRTELECTTPLQFAERSYSDRKQTEAFTRTGPSPKSN